MAEKDIALMRENLREFYFKKVKPNLEEINDSRKINRRNIYGALLILVAFVWFQFFGNLEIGGQNCGAFGIVFFVAGFILLAFNKKKAGSFFSLSLEDDIKTKLMPEFLKIFNSEMKWSNSNVSKVAKDLNIYKTLNIMNPYKILTFDDTICGEYNDVKFNILEADTSIASVKNLMIFLFSIVFAGGCGCFAVIIALVIIINIAVVLSDIFNNNLILILAFLGCLLGLPLFGLFKFLKRSPFRGVLVEFEMNKNFEGHTFILERALSSSSVKFDRSKFEEVKLEDPEFMEKYIVYSDNQVEARYILTTAFIERFRNMKMAFKAKFIRAAFKDGKITISVNAGRDLFAMCSYNKDTDSNTFMELFDELLSVFELINALKLNQKIGL